MARAQATAGRDAGRAARLRELARRALIRTARPAGTGSLLVLAPHPDDETLGCGARIAAACRAGVAVTVVVATDGAASHGAPDTGRLRALRAAELAEATAELGLAPVDVIALDHPDGELAGREAELAEVLARLIDERRPDEVCCTSRWESHPDHAAAARAMRLALARTRARPVLSEYPIWLWGDWPLSRRWLLRGTPAWLGLILRRRVHAVQLAAVRDRKHAALAAYRSQLGEAVDGVSAGLPPAVLERARTGPELFFRMG